LLKELTRGLKSLTPFLLFSAYANAGRTIWFNCPV